MFRCTLRCTTLALAILVGAHDSTADQGAGAPETQHVDELLARGMALHRAGDLLGAVQNYEVALEAAPDRADIRSNLGAAYVALGRFRDGIEAYRAALATADDPAIRLNLAIALYKSGRTEAAIPELRQVLHKDSANRQAALLLADCLLQDKRDREVIELLTPRDDAFADDLAYAYLLGTALLRNGQTQRGEILVDRIFQRGDSAEGHVLMGMAYLNKRDYPNAVTELALAVKLNPALPSAQVLYGRALLGAGDREAALRAFRTALEQEPNSFEANLQVGTLYRLDQRFEDAMLYLRRAAAIEPESVALRHSMAAAYLGLGNVQKAREMLEAVIRDAPDFVDGHVLLATAYYRLKLKAEGDQQREIIARLTQERQAKQPGAQAPEPERATSPDTSVPLKPPGEPE